MTKIVINKTRITPAKMAIKAIWKGKGPGKIIKIERYSIYVN